MARMHYSESTKQNQQREKACEVTSRRNQVEASRRSLKRSLAMRVVELHVLKQQVVTVPVKCLPGKVIRDSVPWVSLAAGHIRLPW